MSDIGVGNNFANAELAKRGPLKAITVASVWAATEAPSWCCDINVCAVRSTQIRVQYCIAPAIEPSFTAG